MFKTIKSKFIFSTTLFIIISIGLPTFFLLIQLRNNFQQRSVMMSNTTLEVVYKGIMNEMLHGKNKRIQSVIEQVASNENIAHIRIFDEAGVIKYASDSIEIGSNIEESDPHHMEDIKSKTKSLSRIDARETYSATRPIINETSCQKCHQEKDIIAFLDIDIKLTPAERAFYTGSLHIILLSVLIVVILLLGFYFLFNRFINQPLKRFVLALNNIDEGNLDARLPAETEDEFGIIENNFNRMAKHLQESRNKIEDMHFEQLERADKMVTLGELAAEMAHEINNPAAIIMSRSDYLLLEAEDDRKIAFYKDDLRVILKQTEKISRITGSILKYSKKLAKNFEEVNLLQALDDSVNILLPRFNKMNIDFKKSYECSYSCPSATIYGDYQQMEQVFTNLLNNAADAMPGGGELHVEVCCLSMTSVRVKITDSGQGMNEEVMSNIFSPFYTTKSADKGTGLGLFIVRNICNNHNAEISCESKPDGGTTFTIIFNKNGN